MSRKFGIIAIVLVVVGALVGGIFGRLPMTTSADNSVTQEKVTADYREALSVIDANYVSRIDHEKVSESSIQGMLWSLDPHSSFFTRDEFRKLYEDQASQFYGIGVSILQHRDGVYVQSIIPNTPADKAGLHYGDRFLEIEGKDARKYTSAEVSKNVRGERGTTVNIKIERAGQEKPLEFNIVRGGVPLPSIRNYFMLKDGVGYVGFTGGFQETSADELDEAMSDLKKQGMKSLVLDLRGNPGGLLPQAIEVVSRFVPRGQTVVSVKGRSRYAQSQDLRAVGDRTEDLPLVVMINGGSASASEIVAGAIQDYGRGVVVGTDSFGKGLVQRVFPLPFGTGLTLTTARYYTPFGRSLQKDYSSGSIYDYYTNHDDEDEASNEQKPKPVASPMKTAGGRIFNSGRGIEPDLKAPALAFTPLRFRLNDAAFFFVRQLVAGQIKGLENYKVEKQNYNQTVAPNDLQINDKMLEAFRLFVAKDKENGLSVENVNSQIDYARARIRQELATANYSDEAGRQVLLENDPQILKAIDAVPEARKLLGTYTANK
ncbi:MAG: Carboxyl-terminal protease [uncultured Pyrinomonadaceae bacterium]|uniref:Carboxyl-terminal protease n=1 Tax=uncultured Pyrinomonadaceae bacterium TaxID=2283094 RepID=A0A6J4PPA3_9BACT|nr:MAG: Carboxyl-terminal protease [uncultured Pyrinomonadaceae bacterium]